MGCLYIMREKEAGTDNKKRMLTTEIKKPKTMEINGVLRDFILCIEIYFVKFYHDDDQVLISIYL